MVAIALLVVSYAIYINPKFKKHLIGIPKNAFRGSAYGIGLFAIFFVLMNFSKEFSIGLPPIPQSLVNFSFQGFSLGTPFSMFILVVLFPFAETFWKSAMVSLLMGVYHLTIVPTITIIAALFAGLHSLAYGIILASAENFGVALNQLNAIGGLLITASLFGAIATFFLIKSKNLLPIAIAHSGVNYAILTVTLALISLS